MHCNIKAALIDCSNVTLSCGKKSNQASSGIVSDTPNKLFFSELFLGYTRDAVRVANLFILNDCQ